MGFNESEQNSKKYLEIILPNHETGKPGTVRSFWHEHLHDPLQILQIKRTLSNISLALQ